MKFLMSMIFTLFAMSATVFAQVEIPPASPKAEVEQVVGLSEVEIEYSRPGAKGRTIFGDLVPYGKLWRTGANASTKVTFDDDVTILGKELKEGTYALYTTPGEESWEVVFYKNLSFWGTPQEYNDEDEALKVSITPTKLNDMVETFTIYIDHLSNSKFHLNLAWEHTNVAIPVELNTDEEVMARIDQVMAGPTGRDYYLAARYLHTEDKDHEKALEWYNKAMSMEKDGPKFWQLRQKSLLQASMGDVKGALESAKMSLEKAKEAGNDDYVKMNMDSIKEWSMK